MGFVDYLIDQQIGILASVIIGAGIAWFYASNQ